jgi:hypothetical protein
MVVQQRRDRLEEQEQADPADEYDDEGAGPRCQPPENPVAGPDDRFLSARIKWFGVVGSTLCLRTAF